MLPPVRAVGRWLVVVGLVFAAAVGVLYVAVPPNETADEGRPDPILRARRPVIRALRAVGVLKFDERLPNPYLPTGSGSSVFKGDSADGVVTHQMKSKHQPVYRGLLWPVGARVTYSLQLFGEHRESWRAVRLCYVVDGQRFVAAENGTPEPGGQLAEVSGFVPLSARGWWIEHTDERGDVHSLNGWGDADPFWRD